jgi:hypothetical protein
MSQIKELLADLKEKNFNELDKDDRAFFLYDNAQDISEFYIKKGHKAQKEVAELFKRFENPKVAKGIKRILKTQDEYPLPVSLATVIADFLEKSHQNLDEEVVSLYGESIDKILKKRIKKVVKKVRKETEVEIDTDLLKDILVVVPEPEAISNPRFVGIYVNRILRKLYTIAKTNSLGLEDVETVRALFTEVFGVDVINDVAVNVLLERREKIAHFNETQKAVWNLMTNFALDVLESNKKKELKELVAYYAERRAKDDQNQRDAARRIQFAQVSKEDYPKLHKVAAKLSEDENFGKALSKYL